MNGKLKGKLNYLENKMDILIVVIFVIIIYLYIIVSYEFFVFGVFLMSLNMI